jgi:hypothetical protein
LQEEDAKVDITQHAIARIAFGTVWRVAKQRRRHRAEPLERGNPELFLAVKVVKEAAFGDARSRADVIDRAAGIALGPNDVAGRILFDDLSSASPPTSHLLRSAAPANQNWRENISSRFH